MTWATAKAKIDGLFKSHDALVLRVTALETAKESDRITLTDRLARIETKLDTVHIRLESNRT